MMTSRCLALGACLVVVGFSASAWAIDLDNGTLRCGTTATYYPRGDYWVTKPTAGAIAYRLQDDGTGTGLASIPGHVENDAIDAAFQKWMAVTCTGGATPRVRLQRGADYPTRDTGDHPDADGNIDLAQVENIVFFVTDDADWTVDHSILAFTNNLSSESGRTVTADMQINAIDFTWRASTGGGASQGCAKPAEGATSTCYDVYSTVIHEVGHFLGLNHVSCTDAVMYPYSTPTTTLTDLSLHEKTAICAMYPHSSTASATALRGFGEVCGETGGAACATGLNCIIGYEFTDGQNTVPGWGVCTSPCVTDDNCPTAFVCTTDHAGDKYCAPGLHNTGSTAIDTTSQNQCTPCTAQGDCANGLCVASADNPNQGFCSKSCDAQFACPAGFTCTQTDSGNICYPDDPSACGSTGSGRAQLNEICYNENGDGSTQTQDPYSNNCDTSLICVGFRGASCLPQIGACVYFCSSQSQIYSGERCPDPNQTCCYGINADGTCNTRSDGTHEQGGCFTIRKVGETCAAAEDAICEPGAQCLYGADNAGGAACFQMCTTTGVCDDGSTCVPSKNSCGQTIGICCDSQELAATKNCAPRGVNVLRDLGVECSQASDCASGICYNLNGKSACSRRCNVTTSAGCPGNIDVNGDAKADGGFYCSVNSSDEGWCWPKTGPADYLQDKRQAANSGGGCAATMADMRVIGGLAAVLVFLRSRRRNAAS